MYPNRMRENATFTARNKSSGTTCGQEEFAANQTLSQNRVFQNLRVVERSQEAGEVAADQSRFLASRGVGTPQKGSFRYPHIVPNLTHCYARKLISSARFSIDIKVRMYCIEPSFLAV
jgi:hypothetical protein